MPYTINLTNSIWPNGVEDDTNGYAVFKRLGVDKIPVPTTGWPKGTKLVSPFVYENGKLTGFVDTKAMTVEENTSIYLPYEHIEADFSSINYGKLSIHAPNAIVKKASWANSSEKSIPEADFKYKTATETQAVATYDYLADIANGVWSEPLWDLKDGTKLFYESELSQFESQLPNLLNGSEMFHYCSNLTQFDSDLPKLENGSEMFRLCTALDTFSSNLSSLTNGYFMFDGCSALISFSSNLSSLTNGSYMFYECTALDTFSSDSSSLTNGDSMFRYCSNLALFDTDLPKLEDGSYMFYECTALSTFYSDLSSLTNGYGMFRYCSNLALFDTDLPKLEDGSYMFSKCDNLTQFTSDLSSLKKSGAMFTYCSSLASFSQNLSNVSDGVYMFLACISLTTFNSDLSSLTNGYRMFNRCNLLTSFNSDLRSLTNGLDMFSNCKLNTASVQNIADTINTPTSKGTIHIGIGNTTPNEQEETAFNTIASKNWTVYVGVNGSYEEQWSPTATTPIDGEQTVTPIPFWAKSVQSDEEHASYIDSDGNYYNILGAQFIYGDDLSTYGMFISEEDAAANMRLIKFEKPKIERN